MLAQELLDYEMTIDQDANDTYSAFRVGTHHVLVTAQGLAVLHDPPRPPRLQWLTRAMNVSGGAGRQTVGDTSGLERCARCASDRRFLSSWDAADAVATGLPAPPPADTEPWRLIRATAIREGAACSTMLFPNSGRNRLLEAVMTLDTQEQLAERQERAVRHALPGLIEAADELLEFVDGLFEPRITYDPTNGADVMVLSFVTKQHEHMRSIRVLIDAGLHRDAFVIARVMQEGFGKLRWAFLDIPARTDLWFWYGAILDWRLMLDVDASGRVAVDPDQKQELRQLVDQHGRHYFRQTVRDKLAEAQDKGTEYQVPDDPWENNWTTMSVAAMFTALDKDAQEKGAQEKDDKIYQKQYDKAHRLISEWVHWGPRAIYRAMERAAWGVSGFTQTDWHAAGMAMAIACMALWDGANTLEDHFSLGKRVPLDELDTKLSAVLRAALAAEFGTDAESS